MRARALAQNLCGKHWNPTVPVTTFCRGLINLDGFGVDFAEHFFEFEVDGGAVGRAGEFGFVVGRPEETAVFVVLSFGRWLITLREFKNPDA